MILLGLKSDLRHKKNCIELLRTQGLTPVTTEQGRTLAQKMNAVYMECSSKEMSGVNDIFEKAIIAAVGDEYKGPNEKASKAGPATKKKKNRSCKIQ